MCFTASYTSLTMGSKWKYYFTVICTYNNIQYKMCKIFKGVICLDDGKHSFIVIKYRPIVNNSGYLPSGLTDAWKHSLPW